MPLFVCYYLYNVCMLFGMFQAIICMLLFVCYFCILHGFTLLFVCYNCLLYVITCMLFFLLYAIVCMLLLFLSDVCYYLYVIVCMLFYMLHVIICVFYLFVIFSFFVFLYNTEHCVMLFRD